NYYYKRKDVGDIVVKYVEQGSNTPIDTPTTMSGAGKSGLTIQLHRRLYRTMTL
ncbi:hypothetical protein HMPREF9099_01731, partial [Lachnospiraceae bacterium oral taxon 082 str. F0431]